MDNQIADGYQIYMDGFSAGVQPDPSMLVDEWSDRYMVIPKKSGAAESGPYRTDRTPYARDVMRCLSPGHPCRRVIVKGASQLLKTQVGLNWIAASIHQAPANILTLLPTLGIAKRVSSRIAETIKAIPELRERVAEPRSRDSKNTADTKEFDGGTLYITTAGSASNLAEIPARYVYGDEIDRWDTSVDGEGDPVELAEARTSTFEYQAKIYFSSSPTLFGASRIQILYEEGDQRRYHVPCPHCDHYHIIEWERIKYDAALTVAWSVCPECGGEIQEHEKSNMLPRGVWIAQTEGDGGRTVSFELSALNAPLGWVSWLSLAKQYEKAKAALARGDQEAMQVFYNTRLARVWNPSEESAKSDQLKARAEDFRLRTIPAACLVLTSAVDVQPNRLELDIIGWGEGMERWTIDHQVIWGSPAEDAVWRDLDGILGEYLPHPSGTPLPISATCIDSGGANTQDVYNYCRLRRNRKILAIKGASRPGRPIIANKPSKMDVNFRGRSDPRGVELWFIGTDTAKDWLASRWNLETGPGAIHFSKDLPDEYYKQLTAERRLTRYRKGHRISEWVKNKADRNEALDTSVYNLAAAYFLGLHRKTPQDWATLRRRVIPAITDLFASPVHTSVTDATPTTTPTTPPVDRPPVYVSPSSSLAPPPQTPATPKARPEKPLVSDAWSTRL
jgi:phage terminase large subunit GpA-like protein